MLLGSGPQHRAVERVRGRAQSQRAGGAGHAPGAADWALRAAKVWSPESLACRGSARSDWVGSGGGLGHEAALPQ